MLGSLRAFRRDMPGFLLATARAYGDVAHFRLGSRHVFLLSHPDHIGHVLVTDQSAFVKSRGLERMKPLFGEGLLTSEGSLHLRQRRLVQPAFHQRRLETYGAEMVERAERSQAEWRAGMTLDMAEAMRALTLSVAGRTLFNVALESDAAQIGTAMNALLEIFPRLLHPWAELLERFRPSAGRHFERERERLDRIVYRLIAERRSSGEDLGDVLSMLLRAEQEPGGASGTSEPTTAGTGMTDCQVRDEVLTLLLAGHETTANALAWTWYLLSRNPAAEAGFHSEVDEVLAGRPPRVEDLPRLAMTRRVLAESMRLFPPAWMIGRRALDDYEVEGYTLPAGGMVFMSQWVVHRDARYYPDPERFEPARWTEEEARRRPRFAYFPFGGGPRLCIGESFAWMEGVLLLASLGRRWRPRLVADRPVAILPRVTLRPRGGIWMRLERRRPN